MTLSEYTQTSKYIVYQSMVNVLETGIAEEKEREVGMKERLSLIFIWWLEKS